MNEREFKLDRLLKKALKHIWYFAALAIFASAVAVGYSLLVKKVSYTAEAEVSAFLGDYEPDYVFDAYDPVGVEGLLLKSFVDEANDAADEAIREYLVSKDYKEDALAETMSNVKVTGLKIEAVISDKDVALGICEIFIDKVVNKLSEKKELFKDSGKTLFFKVKAEPKISKNGGGALSNTLKFLLIGLAGSVIIYCIIIYLVYLFNPAFNGADEFFELSGLNALTKKGEYAAAAVKLKNHKKILLAYMSDTTGSVADRLKKAFSAAGYPVEVVDGGPVTLSKNYLALAEACDGLVIVADAKSAKVATVKECLKDAEQIGIKLLGAVHV